MQVGESLTVCGETPYNNRTDQLVAKLSESVARIATNAISNVDIGMEIYQKNAWKRTASTYAHMNKSVSAWCSNFDEYQQEANERHINISSCFSGNEGVLKEVARIYSNEMFHCVNGVINTTYEYRQTVQETVRMCMYINYKHIS